MTSRIKIVKKDHRRRRQAEIGQPIIIDGIDLTPKPLHRFDLKPQLHEMSQTLRRSQSSTFSSVDLIKFRVDLLNEAKRINLSDSHSASSCTEEFSIELSELTKGSFSSEVASTTESLVQQLEENQKIIKIPEDISLILIETETILLLDLPSCTVVVKDTDKDDLMEEEDEEEEEEEEEEEGEEEEEEGEEEESKDEEEDNESYARKHPKLVDAEVQTLTYLNKSRHTDNVPIKTQDVGVFVTNWVFYDDYKNDINNNKRDSSIKRSSIDEVTSNVDRLSLFSVSSIEERSVLKLVNNRQFQDAVCIIERLLANNYYNNEQKRFKGVLEEEEEIIHETIDYKYRMNLLWTYKTEDVNGMSVADIALNQNNEDLIAVGYGKYYFTDRVDIGYVLVWNIKNPKDPERKYRFNTPVMTLKFSEINPNLLAVGLYNGVLNVIDISQRYMNILATSRQFFEPLWSIVWYKLPNEPDEYIMASFENGYVIKFQLIDSQRLNHTQLMRTRLVTGSIRGLPQLRLCVDRITQHQKAQKLFKHPSNPYTYGIITNSGILFRCNTNYLNQYERVVRLHWAAINAIRTNPFLTKIYLTAGNDCWIRFWVEGIAIPFEASRICMSDLTDATWSYSHSTMFITLCGNMIDVWDLQRRIHSPISQTQTPSNVLNTRIEATKRGNCYYIGDIDGNVHVYSLEDIPFPPFFQDNAVKQTVHKMLIIYPSILEKVQKIDMLHVSDDENVDLDDDYL